MQCIGQFPGTLALGMLSPKSKSGDATHHSTPDLRYIQDKPDQRGLLAIAGPTATGKTGLSLALADYLPIAVLSADSRLVYRELDIGTAKPSPKERSQVPHYLIDLREPTETMTVAEYQCAAQGLIQQFHDTGACWPCLVGGTGLYISSVVDGLQIPPVAPQPELRSQLARLGQAQCYAMLQQVDAAASDRIHPNDSVRTIRALEVAYVTGRSLSSQQGQQPPDYPILYVGLDCDSDVLNARIEQRTGQMIDQGLVPEVAQLCQRYGADLPLLKTLGYAEILGYLAGDYDLATAQQLIVKNTRQFAKRQRTWFRKRNLLWFDAAAPDLVDRVLQAIADFF